jgi:hypothetical protein
MTLRRARALAALLIGFAAAAHAQPAGHPQMPGGASPDVPSGPATVTGRLVHERGEAAVAGVDVLLYALSPDGNAGLRQTKTDEGGRYTFTGVSNEPDIVYLVGARPGHVPFGARFMFRVDEREHRVDLAISDPIRDIGAARAAAPDLRVERGCTHLRVSQRHPITNTGSRVIFVPEADRASAVPILEVELPEQAEGFEQIAGGEGLVQDGRRVRFWGPLYPGEQEIEFGYGLPIDTKAFAVGFPGGAPAPQVLAPEGIAIAGHGLRPVAPQTVDGMRYATLRGEPVSAGDSLALEVALAEAAPAQNGAVHTPRAELWLELDDAALEVDERMEVVVDGEGAPLASSAAPLICLALPANAGGLRFSSELLDAGLRRDPSGDLAIHGPLRRGTSQIALSYQLPADQRGAQLVRRFDRDLPLLSVLVADNGVVADTTRLHRRRPARVDDRNYLHLEAFAVGAGEPIELGLQRTPPQSAGGHTAAAAFALFAGLAALGFLSAPLRRRDAAAREPGETEGNTLERNAIVRSLEVLDEDLETGKLSAEDHAAMRAQLRARAAALLLAPQAAPQPAPAVARPAAPSQARFCTACGAATREGDAFCSQCGNKLQASRSEPQASEVHKDWPAA